MGKYVTGHDTDDTDDSYSRQATIEANKDKIQAAITRDPDMNELQRQNMRNYRDRENGQDNPNHNYARGGVVTPRHKRTMAKLRARHGDCV